MKICTICNQTYTNDDLNYCLADGGLLSDMMDDAPPTIMMGKAPITNQSNWANNTGWADPAESIKTQANWGAQPAAPITPWQNQPMGQVNQAYMAPMAYQGQNQTLPIVSLVLGILSLGLVCCYGGFYLGIPAAIIGYIAMNNANNNPTLYSGRGMAIAGMILGGLTSLMAIGAILLFIFTSIFK